MATFVDQVTLHLNAGDGGDGCVSVKREKFKPLAGPDGGNGGDGGDIVLVGDPQTTTLLGFHRAPHRKSDKGGPGMGDHRNGGDGPELVLLVPVGTVVKDSGGNQFIDLNEPGMRFVVAPGGQGGLGNAALASTKRKAPGFALLGTPGWEGDVLLELKVVADIAFVGFPSAGKSSLVAAISAAKPKIADYPFTTLHPNLGVVQAGETRYTVADVPGLIEGASEGRGLGHQFLRHIERARALVILIDLASGTEQEPAEQERILLAELEGYRPELAQRPRVVVGSRSDIAAPERSVAWDGPTFSAVTGDGVPQLVGAMADAVRQARATEPEPEPFVVHRPRPEGLSIHRVDTGAYVVEGRAVERVVALSDITNLEALAYVQERLKSLGVDKALAKAGAQEGDAVHIGGFTFDFYSD